MNKTIIDEELQSITIKDALEYVNKKETIIIASCPGRHERFLFLIDTYSSYTWINNNLTYSSSFYNCEEALRHMLKLGYELKVVDRKVKITVTGI